MLNRTYTVFITKTMIFIIIFTFGQDLFCALLYHLGVSAVVLKLVYYIKEIAILGMGMYCLAYLVKTVRWKIKMTELPVVCFVICLSVYLIIGIYRNGFMSAVMGCRQYVIPIMVLMVGIYIGKSRNHQVYGLVEQNMKGLAIFAIVSTLIERFTIPLSVWSDINMVRFSKMVKGSTTTYSSRLIQNLFTGGVRRAVGVAAEPLLLAYFMIPLFAFCFAKCFFEKKYIKRNVVITALIGICQVLTLTRAIIVSELIGVVFVLFVVAIINRQIYNKKFILFMILCGIAVLYIFSEEIEHMVYITRNNLDGGSAGMHIHQLKKGISYLKTYFYGLGCGSGSNLVAMNGGDNLTTEFAYSNVAVDLSIAGMIFYLMILIKYMIYFAKGIKRESKVFWKGMYMCNTFCIAIWMITGIFSPQMWGMKSVLLTWFLIGVVRGYGVS